MPLRTMPEISCFKHRSFAILQFYNSNTLLHGYQHILQGKGILQTGSNHHYAWQQCSNQRLNMGWGHEEELG